MLVADIIEIASQESGIAVASIKSNSRHKSVIRPRHAAMYIARNLLGMPYQQLGRIFNRDHSSVIFAVKEADKRIWRDEKFKDLVFRIYREIET